MWTEYLNRLLGVTVGFLILAAVVSAWRHHRREPRILWTSVAALLLTGFQGWLGGQVVEAELAPWIVTAHMLVALVIVSLLLFATVYAFYGPFDSASALAGRARRPPTPPGFGAASAPRRPDRSRRTVLIGATATLVAITLIEVSLGTQVRGRVDQALDAGVARNLALSTVGFLDLTHREVSLAVFGVALVVAWSARRTGARVIARWALVTLGFTMLQIGLGVMMAYLSLAPPAQVLHLTVASLLLGAQTVVLLLAIWR
jgi:heme a synthase